MSPTRRAFLLTASALGAPSLAGCVGGDSSGNDEDENEENGEQEEPHPDLRLDGKALSSTFPVELTDVETGDQVVVVHWHSDNRHWHRQPIEIPLDGTRSVRVVAVDRERDPIPLGPEQEYQAAMRRGEDTPADLVEVEVVGDLYTIYGNSGGAGLLFVQLERDGEQVWLSPPLQVEVA